MSHQARSEPIAAAGRAQLQVAAMGLDERLARAARARAALAAAAGRVVDETVAEVGQARRFARREVDSALGLLDALPALADAIRPRAVPAAAGETVLEWAPFGVVLGWHAANSPTWVPTVVAASALVAGNAVVCRPSRRTRRTTARVLAALAGPWPDGALGVLDLPPERAEQLIAHDGVHAVVAHASTATCKRHLALLGRAYAAGTRLRPYIAEASGNDALVVLAGADLDRAAAAAAVGGFANAGQLCMAAKRIIVEEGAWGGFRPRLAAAVAALVVGDPDDERTDVAPIAPGPARERAAAALAEALARGGEPVAGDPAGPAGAAPLVLRLPAGAADVGLWREETFAPLRGLMLARDADEAVALANGGPYGLGAAVFGPAERALAVARRIRAARLVVNEGPLYQDAHLVVGGVGDSGFGGARPKIEQLVFARRVHRAAD